MIGIRFVPVYCCYNDRNWEQSAGSADGRRDVHTEACGDLGELAPDLGAERDAGRGALGLAATATLAGDEHLAGLVGGRQGLDRVHGVVDRGGELVKREERGDVDGEDERVLPVPAAFLRP